MSFWPPCYIPLKDIRITLKTTQTFLTKDSWSPSIWSTNEYNIIRICFIHRKENLTLRSNHLSSKTTEVENSWFFFYPSSEPIRKYIIFPHQYTDERELQYFQKNTESGRQEKKKFRHLLFFLILWPLSMSKSKHLFSETIPSLLTEVRDKH